MDFEFVRLHVSTICVDYHRSPELKAMANEPNEPANAAVDRHMDNMMYALFMALRNVANDRRAVIRKLVFHPSRSTRRVIVANKITEALMMLLGVSFIYRRS
jgi:hypothetical protein